MEKIVFVIYGYYNGGAERRLTNLSNELSKQGFQVEILALLGVADKPYYSLNENVKLATINKKTDTVEYYSFSVKNTDLKTNFLLKNKDYYTNNSSKTSLQNRIKKAIIPLWKKSVLLHRLNDIRYKRIIREYLKQANPQIVVTFSVSDCKRALMAAKGMKFKLFDAEIVTHFRIEERFEKAFKQYLKMLKKVDGVIVQTQSEKDYYMNEIENVYVINNPIINDLPERFKGERNKIIVNFCRVAPTKNLELLLEAFSIFHLEYPEYILEIYGNINGELEREYLPVIEKKIEELHLEECALILPPSADVHKKVLQSARFVSSSNYEGLSNSMLEAMAIGLPCICTDCFGGGTREVMIDHENGLIVPMNDSDAMYKAMKEFVENPDLAEKCSRNAEKIRDKLSVEKITQQWLDVIG